MRKIRCLAHRPDGRFGLVPKRHTRSRPHCLPKEYRAMAIDLTKPLSWRNASHDEQRMLRSLQGNILKGHGRPATVNVFFKIDPVKKQPMRAALREIANYHAISAYQQLIETDTFHDTGQSGSPFVSVFLSATGYAALGVPNA